MSLVMNGKDIVVRGKCWATLHATVAVAAAAGMSVAVASAVVGAADIVS